MVRTRAVEPPAVEPSPLGTALAEAVAEQRPLDTAVSDLEDRLRTAVADCDYAEAARLQNDLEPARSAAAVAAGRVAGLRAGIERIAAQRAAEQAEIDAAHRRDAAVHERDAAESERQQAAAEAEEHFAQAESLLDAARLAFCAGRDAELVAHDARGRVATAEAVLTGQPAPRIGWANAGEHWRGKSRLHNMLTEGI